MTTKKGYSANKSAKRAIRRTQPPINTRILPTEFASAARRVNRDGIDAMLNAPMARRLALVAVPDDFPRPDAGPGVPLVEGHSSTCACCDKHAA